MIVPQPNSLNCPFSQWKENVQGKQNSLPSRGPVAFVYINIGARKTQAAQEETDVETVFRHSQNTQQGLSPLAVLEAVNIDCNLKRAYIRGPKVLKVVKAKSLRLSHESPHTNVFVVQFGGVWSEFVFWHPLTRLNCATPIVKKSLNKLQLVLTTCLYILKLINQRFCDIR